MTATVDAARGVVPVVQLTAAAPTTTVALTGDVDTLSEPTLTLALASAVARPTALTIIECHACTYLSGRSVEDVVDAAESLRQVGGVLRVAGASPPVRSAFTLLGASHLLA